MKTVRLERGHVAQALRTLFVVLLCVFAVAVASRAQSAETLSQVKKIYVDSFGSSKADREIASRVAARLRASHKFVLVANAEEADAVIRGTGRIWIRDYVSLSVHPSRANSRAELDGYLSAEIVNKSGSTLWSYLVTPSKFSVKRLTTDLADQFTQKLLEALAEGNHEANSPEIRQSASQVTVHFASGTFPLPLYQKWIESFLERSPNVHINYDPVGSESAIRLLTEGSVDFAGSDMPISDQQMSESKVKFQHFSSVLGAVVPIYNLRNVNQILNFTPEALAGIYLGTIRKWNDPVLRAANPGVSLPDSEIVVVHRSDGSGTTFVWADYLSKVSPEWKAHFAEPTTTISWPVGRGAEKNEGVAALVRQTPNSIGYVELIYAIQHELRYGAVRNASGNYVKADLASVTAAAAGIAETANSDFRVSITNSAGRYDYPISAFTWLLLPAESSDPAKRAAIIEFLRWALTAGQKQCSSLGYPPLPAAVANRELQFLSTLK